MGRCRLLIKRDYEDVAVAVIGIDLLRFAN